jgi:hypothetical protein
MAIGTTIDGLNTVTSLTAQDKVPVWDAEASNEPTKKITAQNMANSVKSLANLPNTTEMNAAIAAATDGRVFAKTITATTNSIGLVTGSTEAIVGVANVQILGAYLARGSFGTTRRVTVGMYGNSGYYLLCEDGGNAIVSQSVTLTVFYTSPISAT